ncbi:winged helix-turn-helix domain-containing protein [Kitasatospora sp. SUK 42]|uniref:winged helix-turn-helix domain-containing protein n=1 Tax=Kitasatospora sp. SUK 42 TaxID=1588882 RepID=UPI001C31B7ED|nr:winged helix-turn-helix domain-containing protein [Kitasatospora sp. SUK 42]MBV2156538.1 winged helix-turn-helix domain-containing protein [Kitasatospora sp. SUK 42]
MVVRYPRLDAIFSDHPAAVRRQTPAPKPTGPTRGGDPDTGLVVNPEQRTVTLDGQQLDLPYLEFELLAHLVGNPLRVHSRRQLMETVWGRPDTGDTRTIATHIARIRRKLGPGHREAIATVRQIGYKYDPRLVRAA